MDPNLRTVAVEYFIVGDYEVLCGGAEITHGGLVRSSMRWRMVKRKSWIGSITPCDVGRALNQASAPKGRVSH